MGRESPRWGTHVSPSPHPGRVQRHTRICSPQSTFLTVGLCHPYNSPGNGKETQVQRKGSDLPKVTQLESGQDSGQPGTLWLTVQCSPCKCGPCLQPRWGSQHLTFSDIESSEVVHSRVDWVGS